MTSSVTKSWWGRLRKVLGDAGIEGVSPHMFRRNEHVDQLTAELLDAAFAREDDGTA